MALISTDDVLLEVRNRKEGCHAWSLIAMTSHVRALNMLLFQDSTSTSITLFVQTSVIRLSNVGMSSTPNQVHSWLLAYHQAMSLWFHKMFRVSFPSS
jgi:hypothetical protein